MSHLSHQHSDDESECEPFSLDVGLAPPTLLTAPSIAVAEYLWAESCSNALASYLFDSGQQELPAGVCWALR